MTSPSSPPYSLKPLQELVHGDAALLNNLLNIFIRDCNVTMQALAIAVDEQDYRSIKELAHGLKGISGHLQASSIMESAKNIEIMVIEKAEFLSIQIEFQTLQHDVCVLLELLEKQLPPKQ